MSIELQTQEQEMNEELTFEEKIAIYEEKLDTIGTEPYERMRGLPLLTREEEAKINIKIQEGDKRFRDYFIIANIRLVTKIATKYDILKSHFHNFEKDDLIQEGIDGLIRATETFDHTKGFKFSTYATPWIEQRIDRAINSKGKEIRYPNSFNFKLGDFIKMEQVLSEELNRRPTRKEIAERMDISLEMVELLKKGKERTFVSLDEPINDEESSNTIGEQLEDPYAKKPEEEALKQALKDQMYDILENILCKDEQEVIKLRYGLNGDGSHTLIEIAKVCGMKRERVRQIELRARRKLRKYFF
jgi:RNA polymerase primary sigma factor